ncbi:HEAT repeat domain-containing protein [bacterium]|nr:HEAT repeat domain-containing protein [bacterium]
MKKLFFLSAFCVMFVISSLTYADNIDDALKKLKTGDEDTRKETAEYLGSVGDERVVKALMEAMSDPSDDVREKAAKALGKVGGPECTPLLIRALQDDKIGVRSCAVKSLGKVGDATAIDALQEVAASTWNPLLSQSASKSIMQIKGRKPKE